MVSDRDVTYGIIGIAARKKCPDCTWDIERTKRKDGNGQTIYMLWVKDANGQIIFEKELFGLYRKDNISMKKCMELAFEIVGV